MPSYIEKVEKMTLPTIPLRGMVAFPSLPITLELERDFSIAAAAAAGDSDRLVFLVCQKDIETERPGASDLALTGTVARIRQSVSAPDGIVRIVAEGFCRGTLTRIASSDPYYVCDIMTRTLQLRDGEDDIRIEALRREVSSALATMLAYRRHLPPRLPLLLRR